VEEVTQQSRRYGEEHFATHERPLVSARLNWHLEQGHRVVLVSASPQIYVERIAEILGAHGAIGTRLASDSVGALTGNYLGNNCRGAEKLHRNVLAGGPSHRVLHEDFWVREDVGVEVYICPGQDIGTDKVREFFNRPDTEITNVAFKRHKEHRDGNVPLGELFRVAWKSFDEHGPWDIGLHASPVTRGTAMVEATAEIESGVKN
jgi:hypothetical protein